MASTEELISSADDALNEGIYSYSLGELATFRNPTWADCSPIFLAALRELDVPLPYLDTALVTLLEHHILRLVEGAVTPGDTLDTMYRLYVDLRYAPQVKVSTDVLDQFRPFVDRYHAIEEYVGYERYRETYALPQTADRGLPELYAEALACADEWCRNRWGPELDPSWLTSTVRALAQGIRAEKAFERLPILADALQDAGCANEELLDHLRTGGPHVRCCVFADMLSDPNP
jgi:hypothetical protein